MDVSHSSRPLFADIIFSYSPLVEIFKQDHKKRFLFYRKMKVEILIAHLNNDTEQLDPVTVALVK